jgi:ATP-dependent DNA helicase RecG
LDPTEVLAKQHILNISKYFLPLGIKVALLTGSTKPKEKEQIKQQIKTKNIDFVLGTHAIIQDDVEFADL